MTVDIYGQSYRLLATEGGEEELRTLAGQVDRKMREIASAAPTVDVTKIAILAALNLCDDLRRLEKELESQHREAARQSQSYETKASGWIRRLEEQLQA